mmetsp:Transcript_50348/g.109130  ORF Transcript_50348/g.109130 Transcript_50348/m.109130 type:complete len:136 (+) Transcript_50348:317-724(+)
MRPFAIKSNMQLRTASAIHRVISESFVKGVIYDGALKIGRALNITRVEVSPSLHEARVFWEPIDDSVSVKKLQSALDRRIGIFNLEVNAYLRQKRAAKLRFVLEPSAGEMTSFQRRLADAFEKIQQEQLKKPESS